MIKTIIVADDMTGANVSNSLLAKNGMQVGTLIDSSDVTQYRNFDAFGVHTDSRGIAPQEAYERVYRTIQNFKGEEVAFFNKRIDSTLRGNLGNEIDGMLDALEHQETAVVVSAFPNSGKIVVGGYMLVHGELLELTDVANDPTAPVTSSIVTHIIAQQTKYPVGQISIETVLQGSDAITQKLLELRADGCRIISVDACSNEEIETIAHATLQADIPFISVDPGPFTEALVKQLVPREESKGKQKILFLIGSVSTVAISQIANLTAVYQPYTIKIDTEALVYDTTRQTEIDRVVYNVLEALEDHQMFLVSSRIDSDDKLDLEQVAADVGKSVQEVSELISDNIATIGQQIVQGSDNRFGAFYTSGGDITQAFLHKTATKGIEIKDEIIPLAVYGRIMSGELDGKAIITKGGLIGDKNTLTLCAEYLQTKISTTYFNKDEGGDL